MNLIEQVIRANEILEELSSMPNEIIESVLVNLLCENKINFLTINKSYIESLNRLNKDKDNEYYEALQCVLESFYFKKESNKDKKIDNFNHTQRCLYLLNKSNRFMPDKLNEKYHYDEDYGKSMSWYERNKKEKKI